MNSMWLLNDSSASVPLSRDNERFTKRVSLQFILRQAWVSYIKICRGIDGNCSDILSNLLSRSKSFFKPGHSPLQPYQRPFSITMLSYNRDISVNVRGEKWLCEANKLLSRLWPCAHNSGCDGENTVQWYLYRCIWKEVINFYFHTDFIVKCSKALNVFSLICKGKILELDLSQGIYGS